MQRSDDSNVPSTAGLLRQAALRSVASPGLALALLASPLALAAAEPDPRLAARSGEIRLTDGDPGTYFIPVVTGGGIDAHFDTDLPDACDGDVAAAPGVQLDYAGAGATLAISAEPRSGTRPTLLVHAPDGRWYCDHGNLGRRLPAVRIDRAASGRYAIWVGAYESVGGDAELAIERLPAR